MTKKTKTKSKEKSYVTNVANIIESRQTKSSVKAIELYCAACTKTVVIRKKENGILIPQQGDTCPHIIFKKLIM